MKRLSQTDQNSTKIVNVTDPSSNQDAATKKYVDDGLATKQPLDNLLINGGMDVWKRGTTFTTFTDDTYGPDRWNLLSSTTARWTVSQSTDVPTTGPKYSAKCVLASSTNTQFGMVYFLENLDALKLNNQVVSISFWAKTTTAKLIDNLRCAVLSWSSTADVITSDVVGTWAGAGSNPTWATNWTAENTPSNLALTTAWTQYTVNNILIDTASMANVALVIWTNDTTVALNDEFYITGIQLNRGATASTFTPRPVSQELAMCTRYYQKYTEPHMVGVVTASVSKAGRVGMQIPEMRITPTVTIGALPIFDGSTTTTVTGVDVSYHSPTRLQLDVSLGVDLLNNATAITYSAGSTTLVADAEL